MSWRPSIPVEQVLRAQRRLGRRFFSRGTETVARELIGCTVVVGDCAGRIVEVEAYLGERDLASHAAPGRTPRNGLMFGPAGYLYVYFIYGMYHCMNFVTERDGVAGAVLLRAIEPLSGIDSMRARRPKVERWQDLASGPGKLTLAMGIGPSMNGIPVAGDEGAEAITVWRERKPRSPSIAVSPRVGISKCAEWPLRFFEAGNPCVSRTPLNALATVLNAMAPVRNTNATVLAEAPHPEWKEERC